MKKIFTKQGDAGDTTVYRGKRVSKTDLVIVANGAVDELNCSIGLASSVIPKEEEFESFSRQLLTIQRLLFKLGYSISAVGASGEDASMEMFFEGQAVKTLEIWIEEIEKQLGRLVVRDVFKIKGTGTIAGCYISNGFVRRNTKLRLIRDSVVINNKCEIDSLKHFKEDVREVKTGMECGIKIVGFDDIKIGDIFDVYEILEVARTL